MKKRVKSFLLAILMVFTILPNNMIAVSADDSTVKIQVNSDTKEDLRKKEITVSVEKDNVKIDEKNIRKDDIAGQIVINVSNLESTTNYTLKLSCEGYLNYENKFKPEDIEETMNVTLITDPFPSYAFTGCPDSWELDAKEPKISTNVTDLKGFTQTYSSSDKTVAEVDDSGNVKLLKDGNVTFTARLTKKIKCDEIVYKEINKNVKIKKISHKLIAEDGKAAKEYIYTGQDGSAAYKSDKNYDEKVKYRVVNGDDLIEKDKDFENNGKWCAKDTYGSVTICAEAIESDKYESASFEYTTKIVPYDYKDYQKYWKLDGKKYEGTDIYTSFDGIVQNPDNEDGNSYAIKLKNAPIAMWGETGIRADMLDLKQGENSIDVVIGKITDGTITEQGEATIEFCYDTEAPEFNKFEIAEASKPNVSGWNNGVIKIDAEASDAGSGIKQILYDVTDDNGNKLVDSQAISYDRNSKNTKGTITIPAEYEGESIKVSATAYDNTGHKQSSKVISIKNDSTKPTGTVNLNKDKNSILRFFNRNVYIDVTANDSTSGISSVKYVIAQEGEDINWDEAKELTLDKKDKYNYNGEIIVDKKMKKEKKINVYVKITDLAGNERVSCLNDDDRFIIDIDNPEVNVKFYDSDSIGNNTDPVRKIKKADEETDYYDRAKSAQITVTDRTFDKDKVEILITKDGAEAIDIARDKDAVSGVTLGEWNDNKIDVKFDCGHTYKLNVIATDKAGNSNTEKNIKVENNRSLKFLIDNEMPSGEFSLIGYKESSEQVLFDSWADRVLTGGELSYTVYSNIVTYIEGRVADSLSEVKSVEYIYSDKILNDRELDSKSDWTELALSAEGTFKEQIPKEDKKFIVYLKITDNCDNVRYLSTDGVVYDQTIPTVNSVMISDETKPNGDSWNNSDVKINVAATDNLSGIQTIEYTVTCGDKTLISQNSSFEKKHSDPCDVGGSFTIPKTDAYANDGQLTVNVTAVDMCGNVSEVKSIPVNLDTKKPDGTVTDTTSEKWTTGDKVYAVTAADETSGIKEVRYSIGKKGESGLLVDKAEIEYEKDFTKGKNSVAGKIVLPAKDHRFDSSELTITTYVKDVADNVLTINSTTSIDTTPPTADFDIDTKANEAGWHNGDVTFKTTAYDATSGIDEVTYTITAPDGTVIGEADRVVEIEDLEKGDKEASGTFVIRKSDSPKYDCKNLTVTVKTTDAAGNLTEKTKTLNLDTTKPEAELVGDSKANKEGWHNQKVEYTLNVTDNTSGIKNAVYTVENKKGTVIGEENRPITFDSFSQGNKTASGKIEIPVQAGHLYDYKDLTLKVSVYDIAGNVRKTEARVNVDTTKPDAKAVLSPKTKGEKKNNYFNKDVDVDITASDSLSGIKSISYKIAVGETTAADWKEIFPASGDKTGTNEEVKKTVTIPKELENADWIDVYVKVLDEADNETIVHLDSDNKFRINTAAPVVDVRYGTKEAADKAAYSSISGVEYYNTQRSATVTVTEYDTFFDPDKVQILVSEDGNKPVDITRGPVDGVSVGGWTTLSKGVHAQFEIPVFFKKDHKYKIDVKVTDLSDNESKGIKIADEKSDSFIIDTVNPYGNIKYNGLTAGADTLWNEAVATGRYEISRFSNKRLTVSGKVDDSFSKVKSVSYYVTQIDGALMDLSKVTDWKDITDVRADGSYSAYINYLDKNYTVYVKIIDYSGNIAYISTNGAVVDTQSPKIEVTIPNADTGIYTSDVPVKVSVSDEITDGVSSGIKSITYKVTNLGGTTQEGSLYEYTDIAKSLSGLKKNISEGFTVSAEKNNSNDVLVQLTAVDNAGNTYTTTNAIKIDITAPQIEVSYDNNDGDTSFGDTAYFKESRTATIKVTERNFDETKVMPVITASEGNAPAVSGWSVSYGSGNGDDIVHYATVYYGSDADYTFAASMTDAAGNKDSGVNYGSSLAPEQFTVDMTIPVISVAYDNNNSLNDSYYKETRTATVTINEHNFENSRVQLTMNATDNGNAAETPSIGGWSDSGDTHTATITFAKDAVYTWGLAYTDKAGNKATDLENQNFCVDLTKPTVNISGITPDSANNADGNIGFVMDCTDTNFDTFTPVLTAVVYENGKFVKKTVEGEATSIGNGQRVEYKNLEEDGMYSLTCSASDKAGNVYDTVNITDAQGNSKELNLQAGDELMDFSVNRNGSVFALDEYSMGVVNDHYIQESTQDIVLVETNADPLLTYSITLNGTALEEGVDYIVSKSASDESWNRYEYHIDKSLFDEEGEYNIVAESEDKATSVAYSDLKNVGVDFVVDKTAPAFTISGVEEDGNYRGTSQNVTLVPTDDGGKLGHVKVSILDSDGKEKEIVSDLSGEELTEYLSQNNGKIQFNIPEGINQQISVLCADCSVGADGSTNVNAYVYKGITVSSNAFILFFENKPLFYGTVGGAGTIAVVTPSVVLFRKRKLIRLGKKKVK